jgi:putative cardiolipin synthase
VLGQDVARRRAKDGWRSARAWLVLLGLSAGMLGCGDLPPLEDRNDRTSSTALVDRGATRLEQAISPRVAAHPGKSGIYPLSDAREAFAARVLLARAAERSLDAQYYIWRKDRSGTLLFGALREAADRGVRVRLLLDDNNTTGLDSTLAALDAHPNIEVRLFNPFVVRAPRWIGYLTDFTRLNRRMHNKSFTADNQATIVGGRNVGDEYFDASDGTAFVDLDVLAVGRVVQAVSDDFDRYWASGLSYPVDRLLPPASAAETAQLTAAAAAIEANPAAASYLQAVQITPFVRDLLAGRLAVTWAPVRMVSDPPANWQPRIRDAWDRSRSRAMTAAGRGCRAPRPVGTRVHRFVPGRSGQRQLWGRPA